MNEITTTFPGTFAGKMTFCSAVSGSANLYLTTCKVSDGKHGWNYYPGMNARTVAATEKFFLYLYTDGYYRIQSGDLRWLGLNKTAGFIQFDELENAAAFKIEGNPFGSQLKVKTDGGDELLYYMYQSNLKVPNLLGTTGGQDHYAAFTPAVVTPSLDAVRQQKKAVSADFSNAILAGQNLSQGIDFTSANFVGAALAGVDFSGATLDKADFSKTDLRGLNWGKPASAAGVVLSGAIARNCVFGDAAVALNCTQANFSSADLTGATLSNLNLQQANLAGAILNGAKLDQAKLNNAYLNNVVAIKADFTGATLTDAHAQMGVFTRAIFNRADLTRVKMGSRSYLFDISTNVAAITGELDTSQYPQSNTKQAFLANGITLQDNAAVEILTKGKSWLIKDTTGPYKLVVAASVIQTFNVNPNIIPAVLYGASLLGVTAPTASLAGADLRGVQWFDGQSTLAHADLQDAAFSGALLVGMNFTQANVSGVDFSNSVLIQGNFSGCIAGPGGSQRAISFEAAHLEGVDFSKATFSGAILTGAAVGIAGGVPLLFLSTDDQQYLTTSAIGNLKQKFTDAGFDLGTSPTVADNSQWSIDNSNCPDKNAPRQYIVKKAAQGFNVFANGVSLFTLTESQGNYLNAGQASQLLVSIFSGKKYSLIVGAPITVQNVWKITIGSAAAFLRPYLFNLLQVLKEPARLVVYGTPPVTLKNAPQIPPVAFNATVNLLNALSPNAVGPAGVPLSWIAQELIDAEAFSIAL